MRPWSARWLNDIERGDGREDQSDEQNKIMPQTIRYSCSVDTSLNTPEQCAKIIITSLLFRQTHRFPKDKSYLKGIDVRNQRTLYETL